MDESKLDESRVGRKQGWTKTGWTKTGWTKMNWMKTGSTLQTDRCIVQLRGLFRGFCTAITIKLNLGFQFQATSKKWTQGTIFDNKRDFKGPLF